MKIQTILATVALAALTLTACTTPPSQPAADIKDATGVPPSVPTAPPVGPSTGKITTVNPAVGETFNPLKDFSIYFESDKYDVSDTYIPVVRRHADYLLNNPAKRASLQGNTDERGSREYNLSLGQKRAEAVKKLMLTMGAKESQIEAVSFGEEKPQDPGHNEAAWSKNRRSDITYSN